MSSAQGAGGLVLYEIAPGASSARFLVDEVLRGSPKTVLGQTDQVAGQIAFDPTNAGDAQVGSILINARTLATDDATRDRAIRNFVLSTNENEYVAFTPTMISGLPETVEQGRRYSFQITGPLSIRGVSRDVTFDATVMLNADAELEGTANTTIRYADWNFVVPDVPFVAGVADEAVLELEFVATAV
jgi:polyisoprenoid-binding protein YceI